MKDKEKIKLIALAIIEQQKYGQVYPDLLKDIKEIADEKEK